MVSAINNFVITTGWLENQNNECNQKKLEEEKDNAVEKVDI